MRLVAFPFEGPRRNEYPLPPLRKSYLSTIYEEGAKKLGYHPYPMPAANLSAAYKNPDGVSRAGCLYCGFCERFGCMVGAKAQPTNTLIPVLQHRKKFELRSGSWVRRINHKDGKATGVQYTGANGEEFFQPAGMVVVASQHAAALARRVFFLPYGTGNSPLVVLAMGWSSFTTVLLPPIPFQAQSTLYAATSVCVLLQVINAVQQWLRVRVLCIRVIEVLENGKEFQSDNGHPSPIYFVLTSCNYESDANNGASCHHCDSAQKRLLYGLAGWLTTALIWRRVQRVTLPRATNDLSCGRSSAAPISPSKYLIAWSATNPQNVIMHCRLVPQFGQ